MWAAAAPKNAGEIVKLLLSKGADFKPRALYTDWASQITSEPRAQYRPVGGLTALLYATRDGCYDCVEALIAAGADVNYPTPEGVTPLMIALDNDHNEVAKLLLDHGANPTYLGLVGAHPALHRYRQKRGRARPAPDRDPDHPNRSHGSHCDACLGPSARFEHGDDPHAAGRGCRSESAAQHASSQPGWKQRAFRGGVL